MISNLEIRRKNFPDFFYILYLLKYEKSGKLFFSKLLGENKVYFLFLIEQVIRSF